MKSYFTLPELVLSILGGCLAITILMGMACLFKAMFNYLFM